MDFETKQFILTILEEFKNKINYITELEQLLIKDEIVNENAQIQYFEHISGLEGDIEAKNKEIERLNREIIEIKETRDSNSTLKIDIENIPIQHHVDTIENFSDLISELDCKIVKLEKDIAFHKGRSKNNFEEMRRLRTVIDVKIDENRCLERRIIELQEEIKIYKDKGFIVNPIKVRELREKLETFEKDSEKFERTKEKLNKEIEFQKNRGRSNWDELNSLRAKMDYKDKENKDLQERIKELSNLIPLTNMKKSISIDEDVSIAYHNGCYGNLLFINGYGASISDWCDASDLSIEIINNRLSNGIMGATLIASLHRGVNLYSGDNCCVDGIVMSCTEWETILEKEVSSTTIRKNKDSGLKGIDILLKQNGNFKVVENLLHNFKMNIKKDTTQNITQFIKIYHSDDFNRINRLLKGIYSIDRPLIEYSNEDLIWLVSKQIVLKTESGLELSRLGELLYKTA